MTKNNDKEWLHKRHSQSKEPQRTRLSEEEIISGAHQTDQLEEMKPTLEELKENKNKQAGASPVKSVNKGE
ncbi:hypothetical protein Pedsa_1169 [Pseudopedobacter saltans DSM 12145]|uniref:Uncharacterized protein n=1 Tax=Pseudopedobacter saltans (strain ATCC 51119 / DSM 12145 / JCM 21818 / CCUG 39354 / LMG 10337 / NBRC 100064 / NCIMB 13643) TaxID=762903 RepID=F0SCE0_PSESL|nr:hypothetical protein [Pseudopedobacter saltans]ADY51737.1 hypothetical protein Pedsa_1169 [Pseudopedobacter saltans DSM 12145]